jgi:type I restriction enzyme, S subunit
MMKAEAVEGSTLTKSLPGGWHWVRLRDVCEPNTGNRNPQQEPDKPFSYVDISSVDNAVKRITTPKVLLGKAAPSRARKIIHAGDVIVSTTRPNLNAVALIDSKLDDQICSTGFCVLRAKENLDPVYLFMYVQSSGFVNSLSNLVKGALYPAVTDTQVHDQFIPLPPISEQCRIAAILTEQMAAINKIREAVETQIGLITSLIDSYLRESLSDSNARSLLLNDCLTEVARGVGENWEDYRVIGATRSGMAPAKASVGKSPERYKLVDKGTIFYNPMRILIGSIGMVDEDDEPGITSPDYVVFKTQSGIVHPRWFYYWLRSSFGAAFIKTLARGAVRERILFQRLAKAEILLPSWDTQVKVAEKLSAIAQLKQSLEEQLTATNDLPEKLLHRAFNREI